MGPVPPSTLYRTSDSLSLTNYQQLKMADIEMTPKEESIQSPKRAKVNEHCAQTKETEELTKTFLDKIKTVQDTFALDEFVAKTSLTMDYVDIVSHLEEVPVSLYIGDTPLWLYAARQGNIKVYTASLMLFCLLVDPNMGSAADVNKRYKPAHALQHGFDIDLSELVTEDLRNDPEFMEDYKGVTSKLDVE
jgi:hypothetical protein